MDVVDQRFDHGLPTLPRALATADRVPELALDDRMDGLTLPALPENAVQAGL